MFEIKKVISGGQSGGDVGGLIFADKHEIANEANIFRGFKPIRGETYPKSTKINYVCEDFKSVGGIGYIAKLRCRTLYNVMNSNLTLIFVNRPIEETKGSSLTYNYCVKNGKYRLICDIRDIDNEKRITNQKYFIRSSNLSLDVVNVAGQRELNSLDVVRYLEKVLM